MAGGGKGGSQTTRVQLPQFIESAAERAVQRGEDVGRIGFVPFTGPDVAAFTPQQEAAFAGTNQAASAFGLPSMQGTGLPQPETFAGGVRGFSSAPLFEQALAELQATRPGQFDAINSFFIDPVTGALPAGMAGPAGAGLLGAPNPSLSDVLGGIMDGSRARDTSAGRLSGSSAGGSLPGGFTSVGDMFDGGGPGAAGDTFSGGGFISDVGNAVRGLL